MENKQKKINVVDCFVVIIILIAIVGIILLAN